MPKLREYVKDLAHDIVSTSSKQTLAAPTLGSQYSRDQPVKLELDATPGQQTRQVRSWISSQITFKNHTNTTESEMTLFPFSFN